MKNRKLKLEGEDKIKFDIDINYNEVTIILYAGGTPTKYKATMIFGNNGENVDKYLEDIGLLCEKIYYQYLEGVEIQNGILKSLEDKIYIELNN